ncbi:AAA family ATPase [Pseudogulbenkiania ferrooxidans]|uniref:RecA-family ATPase-like protein n=1 Tax=Pseudogulbenkiania ferrooxidans 2002 TaxID=279714 RepID=B9Z853_9NEIS|nr:AAA family ATPase [Pseudogulbenkiania ferrooxidans]EEG07108.1 RecA-family ATPase-like protein [Pseudogulbenkiania ferrooxidans 2002]
MELQNEGRPGQDGQEGKLTLVQNNDSPNLADLQASYGPFAPYACLKCWVPWKLTKKPGKAKADKVPHSGRHGLSTNDPNDWCTLPDALAIAKEHGLNGVGIVLTGGITVDGKRLVGLDFDVVEDTFQLPFETYCEKSPSGNGVRAFVTVPEEWAAQRVDNGRGHYPGCGHNEIYIGSGGRFLTVTGNTIEALPFADLKGADLDRLDALLKKADKTPASPVSGVDLADGSLVDLDKFPLSDKHRALIAGEIPAGQGKRHPVVRSFLLLLASNGVSAADALATCLQLPGLLAYFEKHNDAVKFARTEIERAFNKAGPQLNELCDKFKKLNPPPQNGCGNEPASSKKRDPRTRLIPIAEAMKSVRATQWLIKNYLEADTLALMFGQSGHYKSFVAIDLAFSVASGKAWHGHKVNRSGPVIFVCGEGQQGVYRRLMAVCQERGSDWETLPLYITSRPFGLSEADEVAWLKELIDGLPEPPVLIVVDTLARNFGNGDENSTRDMNLFISALDEFRGHASVLVVHHTGHANQGRERGSYSLRGATDARYFVSFDDKLRMVHFETQKMKDDLLPPPIYLSPKVVELPLPNEEGEGPITSVVLVESADQKAARVADVYRRFPKLEKPEKRKTRLPLLLIAIHDKPASGANALAKEIGSGNSTVQDDLTALRDYKLIEPVLNKLTPDGIAVAAALTGRADIVFEARPAGHPEIG